MKRISLPLIGVCLAGFTAYGQIEQTSPELCGKPGETVPVPTGIAARPAAGDPSDVELTRNGRALAINVGYPLEQIKQVCPLPDGRTAVFVHDADAWLYLVLLLQDDSVVEDIEASEAVISPDQHWLAWGKFNPMRSQVPPSEEYFLYDLTKSRAENIHKSVDPNDRFFAEGIVIYPAVPQQAPFDRDLPDELRHSGGGFRWAADSKSLIFFDRVNGTRNVVWVRIQDSGHTAAFVRPLAAEDLSVTPPTGWPADARFRCGLSNAEVRVGNYNEPEVVLEFGKGAPGAVCPSKPLVIPAAEFKPAPMEAIPPAEKKKKPVAIRPGEARPPLPPKN